MSDTGLKFVEKTKYQYLGRSDQQKSLPQPPLEIPIEEDMEEYILPKPNKVKVDRIDLLKLINGRRSTRSYSADSLSLEELSYLLWCTQGVKDIIPRNATRRTVPSAGARHAFETYILINRIEGLQPGLYRFAAIEHKIIKIDSSSDISQRIAAGCLRQRFVSQSAVTLIWAAVAYRMTWRYQERGFRYLYLDAGHVCQNLYLAGEAINCGTCAIGAFDDDKLNDILGLDGKNMFVIYVASLGRKS